MKSIKKFALINLGILFITVGVYFFKIPNGFSMGGVSGLATILGALVEGVSPATFILMINIALLVVGFIFLGNKFGLLTVYSSLMFSFGTWLLERYLPLTGPLTNQPFLELIFAVLLSAIGSAILFNNFASSGGTDIIAVILKKYSSVNVGQALMITDSLIALSSFFVFNIEIGLFSTLGLFIKSFLVDGVIESLNLCKYLIIVTSKPQQIKEYILSDMHHGVTEWDAIGSFTGHDRKVLLTVCKRFEGVRLKSKVKEIDPHSFVVVQNTSEILGRGFQNI